MWGVEDSLGYMRPYLKKNKAGAGEWLSIEFHPSTHTVAHNPL